MAAEDSIDIEELKKLAEKAKMPEIENLVFEGGGAKGLCYLGVVKVGIYTRWWSQGLVLPGGDQGSDIYKVVEPRVCAT